MAIRLRNVDGVVVALCAAETDPKDGDVYLDDDAHLALTAKYAQDYNLGFHFEELEAVMATQKLRDAKEECERWAAEQFEREAAI